MNILVTRFSALGDIAMTIPPLYDVCRAYPDHRFILLSRTFPLKMFLNAPANLVLHGVNTDKYRGLSGLRRLKAEIDAKYGPINMVADLHDVVRTKVLRLLYRLGGAKVAYIHKGRAKRKALTRRHHKVLIPLKPTIQRYRDVFGRLKLDAEPTFRSLFDTVEADTATFSPATEPKRPGERWIGVAPFAKHPGKIYPPERMQRVVEMLAEEPDTRIFLFGAGQKENEILKGWSAGHKNVVNVAALQLGLPAELALIHYCDVMLSMDSANMHLASLVGTRVVSIWGATHPICGFMGWNQRDEDALQLDMVCRPCSVFGNKPCHRGDYLCLNGISPQRVVEAVNRSV